MEAALQSVARIQMLTEKDKDQETVSYIVGPEQRVNRQKWPGRGYKRKIKQDSNLWHAVKDPGKWRPVELHFPQFRGGLSTRRSCS